MITGTYAGLLAIWMVILATRVIALRGNPAFRFFAFGRNEPISLDRAIRAHGNMIEYAPFFLILMFFNETAGADASTLHAYGLSFTFGRLMHGICFGFMKKSLPLRIGGTVLTLFPILGLATRLLF